MRAPEFPSELEWFNVEKPIKLADQQGKLVLLHFWTYCSINCLHVLPDLRYLQEKYADGLTIVGLLSPKFANERMAKNIELAIKRHDIRHPVANDAGFVVWQQYNVNAWPTLVLIDTQGNVITQLTGEGHRQQLNHLIQEQITLAQQKGIYQPRPIKLKVDQSSRSGTLAFPGKVLATKDKLYISDSGHHQIVEADQKGQILRVFGKGTAGLEDGVADQANFNNPQGIALAGDELFVADTDNHVLRSIHLDSGKVTTIAGTGEQGGFHAVHETIPLHTSLNSPWDVAANGNFLYIAMAGRNQIWTLDLPANRITAWAGSGREGLNDGMPKFAEFAQPSGFTFNSHVLYLADAESSAIRQIDFSNGLVSTLIGMGLFEFGNKDGIGKAARLQHPLAVTYDADLNALWIADTYNHKIRKLELESKVVSTLAIDETLSEPGGIFYSNRMLWVADTNNHRVVRVDPATGHAKQIKIKK